MSLVDSELEGLLDLLDLEQIEVNIFRGRSPDETAQRVFGGQVAASCDENAITQGRSERLLHA